MAEQALRVSGPAAEAVAEVKNESQKNNWCVSLLFGLLLLWLFLICCCELFLFVFNLWFCVFLSIVDCLMKGDSWIHSKDK
jgi:hypothetical protein